jgi:hypothetical protein
MQTLVEQLQLNTLRLAEEYLMKIPYKYIL